MTKLKKKHIKTKADEKILKVFRKKRQDTHKETIKVTSDINSNNGH